MNQRKKYLLLKHMNDNEVWFDSSDKIKELDSLIKSLQINVILLGKQLSKTTNECKALIDTQKEINDKIKYFVAFNEWLHKLSLYKKYIKYRNKSIDELKEIYDKQS